MKTVSADRIALRTRYGIIPGVSGLRAVCWIFGCAVVATTAVWAVLLAIWPPLGNSLTWAAGPPVDADTLFRDAALRIVATTVTLILVFSLIIAGVGMMLSHRMADSMHRIKLTFRQIAEGHYADRVSLRRGDGFQEFAGEINGMLDRVENSFRAQQRSIAQAHRKLSDLEIGISQDRMDTTLMEQTLHDALRELHDARLGELTETVPRT